MNIYICIHAYIHIYTCTYIEGMSTTDTSPRNAPRSLGLRPLHYGGWDGWIDDRYIHAYIYIYTYMYVYI